MKQKVRAWVFTIAIEVVIPAEQDEEAARAALARRLAKGPNDASQQAWLREIREQEVEV